MKHKFYSSIFIIVIFCTIVLTPSVHVEAKSSKKQIGFHIYPIIDNVYRIEENITTSFEYDDTLYSGYYLVNIYVIELNDTLVLVDAGVEEYGKNLKHFIKKHFGNKKIEAVLLTHAHADHAGGGRFFLNGNTKVYANESDWPSIIDGMSDANHSDFTYTGYSPTNTYAGFSLTNFWIFNTPGHTNGSVSIGYLTQGETEDHEVLFTGDTTLSIPDDLSMEGEDLTFALEFFTLWFGTDSLELQSSSLALLDSLMDTPICPGHKETTIELGLDPSTYIEYSKELVFIASMVPAPPL